MKAVKESDKILMLEDTLAFLLEDYKDLNIRMQELERKQSNNIITKLFKKK